MAILHPPPGGREKPINLPLLSNGNDPYQETAINGDTDAASVDHQAAERVSITTPAATASAVAAIQEKTDGGGSALKPPASGVQGETRRDGVRVGGGGTGNFATRMMHNVQKHFDIDDTITGTLTVSLELFDYGDGEGGLARGEGVREPGIPPPPAQYAAAKFTVAEDANEARRRREREGIHVPRMLSRVQALHDRLGGD